MDIYLAAYPGGETSLVGHTYITVGYVYTNEQLVTKQLEDLNYKAIYKWSSGLYEKYNHKVKVVRAVANCLCDPKDKIKVKERAIIYALSKIKLEVNIDKVYCSIDVPGNKNIFNIINCDAYTIPPTWYIFKSHAMASRYRHIQLLSSVYPDYKFTKHHGLATDNLYLECLAQGLTPYHHADLPDILLEYLRELVDKYDPKLIKYRKYFTRLSPWWQSVCKAENLAEYFKLKEDFWSYAKMNKTITTRTNATRKEYKVYDYINNPVKHSKQFKQWLKEHPP
jgi:hypothetical protein